MSDKIKVRYDSFFKSDDGIKKQSNVQSFIDGRDYNRIITNNENNDFHYINSLHEKINEYGDSEEDSNDMTIIELDLEDKTSNIITDMCDDECIIKDEQNRKKDIVNEIEKQKRVYLEKIEKKISMNNVKKKKIKRNELINEGHEQNKQIYEKIKSKKDNYIDKETFTRKNSGLNRMEIEVMKEDYENNINKISANKKMENMLNKNKGMKKNKKRGRKKANEQKLYNLETETQKQHAMILSSVSNSRKTKIEKELGNDIIKQINDKRNQLDFVNGIKSSYKKEVSNNNNEEEEEENMMLKNMTKEEKDQIRRRLFNNTNTNNNIIPINDRNDYEQALSVTYNNFINKSELSKKRNSEVVQDYLNKYRSPLATNDMLYNWLKNHNLPISTKKRKISVINPETKKREIIEEEYPRIINLIMNEKFTSMSANHRSFEEDWLLRSPIMKNNERQCLKKDDCVGKMLRVDYPCILREYVSFDEVLEYKKTGFWKHVKEEENRLCLLCIRRYLTFLVNYSEASFIVFDNNNSQFRCKYINDFHNIVNEVGEYDINDCLNSPILYGHVVKFTESDYSSSLNKKNGVTYFKQDKLKTIENDYKIHF